VNTAKINWGQQTVIAKLANYSQQMISNFLAGRKRPSWEGGGRLEGATGVPRDLWMNARKDPNALIAALNSKFEVGPSRGKGEKLLKFTQRKKKP